MQSRHPGSRIDSSRVDGNVDSLARRRPEPFDRWRQDQRRSPGVDLEPDLLHLGYVASGILGVAAKPRDSFRSYGDRGGVVEPVGAVERIVNALNPDLPALS